MTGQTSGGAMPRRVDQVLAGFAGGDAISNLAVQLQDIFVAWGLESEIFVEPGRASPDMSGRCRSLAEYRGGDSADLLVHHYSIGSAAVDVFRRSHARKLLIYHNITPESYFDGFDDDVAARLRQARAALPELLAGMDAVWAVSRFNARELEEMGGRDVRVFPLMFSPGHFEVATDRHATEKFSRPMRNILCVGRLAPNKKVENLITAFAWYNHAIERQSRLIIVGSDRTAPRYYLMLRMLATELKLDTVCFERFVSPARLPGYYEAADLFVSVSEHEGYCLPLVEAIYKGVPVIARATGGIPEALGGAGVMYEDASAGELAELMHLVLVDNGLRTEILESQRRRVAELKARRAEDELKSLLSGMFGGKS